MKDKIKFSSHINAIVDHTVFPSNKTNMKDKITTYLKINPIYEYTVFSTLYLNKYKNKILLSLQVNN